MRFGETHAILPSYLQVHCRENYGQNDNRQMKGQMINLVRARKLKSPYSSLSSYSYTHRNPDQPELPRVVSKNGTFGLGIVASFPPPTSLSYPGDLSA